MKILSIIVCLFLISNIVPAAEILEENNSLPDFDTFWDYNNPENTEVLFKSFLVLAEESGDTSYLAQLLTQIARTQGMQMKFEEAHITLDLAEQLIKDDLKIVRIRYLLERGRIYNSSGQPDLAKPLFLEAYDLSIENNIDNYALDAAHMLGIVESPEKQIEWNLIALEIAENTDDEDVKRWLGPLYNNIGWTFFDLEEYDSALEMFTKGLEWRKEAGDENGARIAKWCIGRLYREIGEFDKALYIQHELENEIIENDLEEDGYVYEELAECYLLKGNEENAKKYFRQAYKFLSQDPWLQENESERLERLKELSE